jgi:hypothetical protein
VALELALCARMVKGYGATNERAKESFRSIMNHLKSSDPAAIRRAREAALAEESGAALDAALTPGRRAAANRQGGAGTLDETNGKRHMNDIDPRWDPATAATSTATASRSRNAIRPRSSSSPTT